MGIKCPECEANTTTPALIHKIEFVSGGTMTLHETDQSLRGRSFDHVFPVGSDLIEPASFMENNNEITPEKLLQYGFSRGTDLGDGRVEYYIHLAKDPHIAFYVWDMNGTFTLPLRWEGYEMPVEITLKDWWHLEDLFVAIMGEDLVFQTSQTFYLSDDPDLTEG